VKVIDFGSACMEGKTIYSYIQVLFELAEQFCFCDLGVLLISNQVCTFSFFRAVITGLQKYFLVIRILYGKSTIRCIYL
jgi:hypothetical protein